MRHTSRHRHPDTCNEDTHTHTLAGSDRHAHMHSHMQRYAYWKYIPSGRYAITQAQSLNRSGTRLTLGN